MAIEINEITSVMKKVGREGTYELTPEEESVFHREILDKVKVNIYINQIDDISDFTTARMVWMNKDCQESMGYSLEEARAKGHRLFLENIHQDDSKVTTDAIDHHNLQMGDVFGGLARFINRNHESKWYLGKTVVISMKEGKPWQFLNISMNISDEFHSHDQLMELQRENLRLKNNLKLQRLTKKEKAVLVLIAKGQTDHEISSQLMISRNTARTHHKNILVKLKKHKTAELAVFASECGLL